MVEDKKEEMLKKQVCYKQRKMGFIFSNFEFSKDP